MTIEDPDHALVRSVAQGDLRAYRVLVARHLDRGVKVAERMLGNRQDAEDVMQEACLKIWTEAPRWQPRAKFSTWLYRVVLNACLDRLRKVTPITGEVMDEIPDRQPLADESLISEQRAENVRLALHKLPERQRAAVVLSYYEMMSNQDAADAMSLRLGAFQQLLFRAKRNLRVIFEDMEGGQSDGRSRLAAQ